MPNEKIAISHIGLLPSDLTVIRSVFQLAPALQERCQLVGPDGLSSADVVFVNADSAEALQAWGAVAQRNPLVTPVMVSDHDVDLDGVQTLQHPLSLKKLIAVLDTITSTARSAGTSVEAAAMRILVVDDSYSIRKFLQQKLPELSPRAIHVDFADSGEEAMEKLGRASFDMVFLDVVMPGVDGYQVCKWIKSERPSYVVMLTSKKSPFDKVRGAMSGCDDYITKPPEDARLKKVLEKGLTRRQRIEDGRAEAGLQSRSGLIPNH